MSKNEPKIIPVFIEDEMKTSYLTYAMSVIVARALPDARDGLKPVHRRILFGMHELGVSWNKPYKKCARIVGDVLGKYHPHGDAAVYDALVRLAQDFSLRYPLIDGQGNFGSIDGDMPAAMRYTEARLERIAEEMLRDIDKETVDFQNNFDDTMKEPVVLPAAIPNLLINGASGIAVGMATNMPPHNLREIVKAIHYYIDNPGCDINELIKFVKGPDFPTCGLICGSKGIKEAYRTGRGIVKVRGRVTIEETKAKRDAIIITEIPYLVNKSYMIQKIAELVKEEKIKGIAALRDESDKSGIRVVVELKKDINPQIILNRIYKHTSLESTFGIINLALVNNEPKILNLKELIFHFVNHRNEVIVRRIKFDLAKAEARAHIIEGLIIAINNIDEVIKIIKKSESADKARSALMDRFSLSEIQAQAILDMQLRRLASLEVAKLKEEFAELQKLIAYLKDLLANPLKILALIKDELTQIAEKFGDDRRTEITSEIGEELDPEDYILKENMVIAITNSGYIKRTPASIYKKQNRGGQGVAAASLKDEDLMSHLFVASTHDNILFITNKGKAFWMKIHELPEGSRTNQGKNIKLLLNLSANEEINSLIKFAEFREDHFILMITARGIVKKSPVSVLENAKKRGIQAIALENDDFLVGTVLTTGSDEVILVTRKGLALKTSEKSIRIMGRTARGIRGIRLGKDDEVVGIEVVDQKNHLLIATEKGYGKKLAFSAFNAKGRGGKGQICMKTDQKTGEIASVKSIGTNDGLLIITSRGKIISIDPSTISVLGRPAKGVRLVSVTEPDFVAAAAKIESVE
ncbi:MAG: DNA gyrase subunit A [Spirochaetes bacterium GWF1_41_5]|nr:MAG: DNA gyrase subunit A [Spirochaetes bacterium GWF1_41_5]